VTSTAEQISAAALRILEKEGAAAVSMRRVASAVGITPMAIYHHFEDRAALLTSVVDREFAKLEADFFSSDKLTGEPGADIRRIVDAYVRYALERPRIFDYVFAEERAGARRYPEDFRAGRSPTVTRLAEVLCAGMDAGRLEREDEWEVAIHVWAHVHGYVMLYRAGRFNLAEKSFRALLKRSVGRLLHGLETSV
jgi:AcrR family transcriptional regulator